MAIEKRKRLIQAIEEHQTAIDYEEKFSKDLQKTELLKVYKKNIEFLTAVLNGTASFANKSLNK
jgi:hypothetical protein